MSNKDNKDNKKKGLLTREGFGSDEKVLSPAPVSNGVSNAKTASITIDDISFFALNPRQSENPKYAEIKESIRMIGLENPLTVTKRPGESGFTLYNGGNTRLRALKELWKETGDDSFYYIDVRVMPYSSDSEIMIKHMIENETRGDMLLVDRANAAYKIKKLYEQETGEVLGVRPLSDLLCQKGWKISFTNIGLLIFAAEKLNDVIPLALANGMGKAKVTSIRKTYNALKKYINAKLEEIDADEIQKLYLSNLANYDSEEGVGDDYALNDTCKHIGAIYHIETPRVQFEVVHIVEKGKVYDLESDSPDINNKGQRIKQDDSGETYVIGAESSGETKLSSEAGSSKKTDTDGAGMPKEVTGTTGTEGLSPESLKVAQLEEASHQVRNKIKMMMMDYDYLHHYINDAELYPWFEINALHLHKLILDIRENSDDWDELKVAFICELIKMMGGYFNARIKLLRQNNTPQEEYKLDIEALQLCQKELHELSFESNVEIDSCFYGFLDIGDEIDNVLKVKQDFITLASLLRNHSILSE